MAFKFRSLDEQVVVITGASSGIGLATALAAARRGARVVLAARNSEALAEAVHSIEAKGGQAIAVTADVGVRQDVERIADAARQRFGGFDTWVNNAGAGIYGKLDEVREEDSRRLFDTNFWGTVYGSLEAVRQFKDRGGALINVGSAVSDMAMPLMGMYAASKHAVKGFTDALRMELEAEGALVSVTLIKPTAMDTPFPQHAMNYLESEPKLPDPVYSPEEVAAAILHAATHAEREIYVGGAGRAMVGLNRLAPKVMDWINEKFVLEQQKRHEPPRHPEGTLHHTGPGGNVRGDHPRYVMKKSLYTRASMNPLLTGLAFVGAGVALAALLGRRSGS